MKRRMSTMAELVERHRQFTAAYITADFGDNEAAGEKAFLATADTEAEDILAHDPPPVKSRADLIAALSYLIEDRGYLQPHQERILRHAVAFIESEGA